MIKRQFALGFVAGLAMIVGLCRVHAAYNVGLTPEAEFVTLSDLAAEPASGAGGVAAPVEGGAAPAEAPVLEAAPVVSPASEVAPVAADSADPVTTNAVPAVLEVVQDSTGTGVVSEVAATNGPAETETVPVASFPALEKQNLISVALDDVPLQDVVRLFTKISGANIIASSTNLQGKVTVNLQDVEWKPALDSILDMYNMMVVEKVPGSTIYSVMVKPPGATDPMIAQSIFLSHAQVSNVAAIVSRMLVRDGMVSAFPNANALVVRSTAANLNEIRKVIEDIDVPRQQVYIEAKFLELTDEAIKDLGVNWQVLEGYGLGVGGLSQTLSDERSKFNGTRTGLGTVDSNLRTKGAGSGSGVPGSGATDSRTSSDTINSGSSSAFSDSTDDGLVSAVGATGSREISDTIEKSVNYQRESERIKGQHFQDIRTAVLSADDFRLVLSALQQLNGITIVSNPKIIVANEETAKIEIGNNEPNIKGTVTPGQQGQANSTTYALDTVEPYFKFGINLFVTPTINNQSNITIRIEPVLSRFIRDKTAPDGNTFPIRSTKTIKTVFSLDDGKTAAIGGLTETDEREVVMKVPLLGDIPLIGKYLFTHSHKRRAQTETIIFVTVGLANPRSLGKRDGMPEESALTQKHLDAKESARKLISVKNGAQGSASVKTP